MQIFALTSGRLSVPWAAAKATTGIAGFRSGTIRRGRRNAHSRNGGFKSSFLAHAQQIRHLNGIGCAKRNHPAAAITTTIKSLFTGIVQGTATVKAIEESQDFKSLEVEFPGGVVDAVSIGSSVALNGTCLTVTKQQGNVLGFDVIVETLRATNLGDLTEGEQVNFERAARLGDEIGGHNVSGHIHCTAKITEVQQTENNKRLSFEVPSQWMKYILPKGYIGVDGCSLTIGEVEGNSFSVYLIPETLRATVFGGRKVGDSVNIEIETQTQAIVDTVERVLAVRGYSGASK
ncbi:hypothetical protein BSKO_03008 [Bryopsis sp. KO-2023]|nr:hypothetical protein BSKO_03008 [Bryopsis sp. KO-2023]